LRDWAGDLVHSSRAVDNGWLDGASLERTWADHQSATRNYDYRLWAVLMLESWLQQYG
jgi:asparagine synthase (glutamine-hydrolysing)